MNPEEEIFPIVDEEGKVLGKTTRKHCHDGSNILHPVVHLHVFDTSGKLYLQKRSLSKDIFPGRWDTSVGGHIGLGESPVQALFREAKEELGLTGFDPHFVTRYIIETVFERELVYCYYTTIGTEPVPDGIEVSEGCFWDIDDICEMRGKDFFTPNFESDFEILTGKGIIKIKAL